MKKLRSFSGYYEQTRRGASSTSMVLPQAAFSAALYQLRQQVRAAARRGRVWWKRPPGPVDRESSPVAEVDEYG